MGNGLRHIENVELVVFPLLLGDELHVPCPRGEVALGDILVQVLRGIVLVGSCEVCSLFASEVLDALVGLEVILDVVNLALFVHPLVSVRAVSIHVSIAVGSASVRKEDSDLVKSVCSVGPEIKGSVGITQVGLGVSLLGVQEVGELNGILDEENRGVVADHVVVALLCVELDGEASGVSNCVSRAILTSDSRESQEQRGLLPN